MDGSLDPGDGQQQNWVSNKNLGLKYFFKVESYLLQTKGCFT
jgi:hypothetical protein